jgi:hypothetical protein
MVMDYTARNPLGFLAPVFILALPIADTAFVTVLRLRARRKIYHGSPDHIPLRLRRRLGGRTVPTVLVLYGAAVLSGSLGLLVLFLDVRQTLILVAVSGVVGLAALVWLARVNMEPSS